MLQQAGFGQTLQHGDQRRGFFFRGDDQQERQRIFFKRIQRLAQTAARTEFCQPLFRRTQLHLGHVGTATQLAGDGLRTQCGDIGLEEQVDLARLLHVAGKMPQVVQR